MNDRSSKSTLEVGTEKRIRNEFKSKVINEKRMDRVVEAKKGKPGSSHSEMQFNCECDHQECREVISLSTEEYQRVHREANYFIVFPSHVHLDIEKIISSFSNFALVEKPLTRSWIPQQRP